MCNVLYDKMITGSIEGMITGTEKGKTNVGDEAGR
jgi:hypothetical protein